MATNFPTSLDTTTNLPTRATGDVIPASDSNDKRDAVIAVETKMGIGSSTPIAARVLRGTGTGTSSWAQVDLTADVTGLLPGANMATLVGDSGAGGTKGAVPAPAAGDAAAGKFLKADGTWTAPAGGGGAQNYPWYSWFEHFSNWTTADGTWQKYLGGTGSVTSNQPGVQLVAGTTVNDGAGLFWNGLNTNDFRILDSTYTAVTVFEWECDLTANTQVGGGKLMFGGNGSVDSINPTAVTKSLGFRWEAATSKWFSYCADGTTLNETNLTLVEPYTDQSNYTIRYTPGTNMKFYINGVLKATHTTNMPTNVSSDSWGASVFKGASGTGNQTMRLYRFGAQAFMA
jgi:hypothetical protein